MGKQIIPEKKPDKLQLNEIIRTGKVKFDYIKSSQFRVVHVNGAYGGISPNGLSITMALYNERLPIPKQETYEIQKSGALGRLTGKEQRDAIVREVEVEAVMDLNTAKTIVTWLKEKIGLLEQVQELRPKI